MKYTVATYTDLNGAKLSDRGKEHVINQLEDNDAILWLEDWLREDKGELYSPQGEEYKVI